MAAHALLLPRAPRRRRSSRPHEGKGLPGEAVREMLVEAVEKRFGGVESVP